MIVFFLRMVRDKYKTLLIYSLSVLGFLEMYMALFPVIRDQSQSLDELISTFPPELFKAVNIDPTALSFSNLQSYLSTEYMSFLWPILAIVFAISMASYVVVNEIDKGTIETLVSLPASRVRIFFERYAAGAIMLCTFSLISVFGAIPLAMIHGIAFDFNNYAVMACGSMLFIWAVYSLAILFSSITSEKGRATMLSGGLLALMYVVNIVSTLNDNLTNLQYFSIFYYFKSSEMLVNGVMPEYTVLALSVLAIATTLFSGMYFNKRDLAN